MKTAEQYLKEACGKLGYDYGSIDSTKLQALTCRIDAYINIMKDSSKIDENEILTMAEKELKG